MLKYFYLDRRSLVLSRVLMGFFIIYDLLHRLPYIEMFYTDEGVLSRDFFISEMAHSWSYSLLLINGSSSFTYLFFFVYFFLAVAFIVGYKTKLVTFLLWIFTVSLHDRNWWVLNGGDDVLRIYLFFMMFLPISGNLDAFKKDKELSFWTFGYFIQVSLIYLTTVLYKDSPEWRSDFTATEYALGIDNFVSYMGALLREFPVILKVLTGFTIIGEFICGTFLLFGFLAFKYSHYLRFISVFIGLSFHLGLIIFMTLGDFAFFCLAMWVALLPSEFWERLGENRILIIINKRLKFWSKTLSIKDSVGRKSTFIKILSNGLALLSILSIFYWNLQELYPKKVPEINVLKNSTRLFHLYQRWNMFAPFPYSHNEWLSMPGEFQDGFKKDLMDYGYKGSAKKLDYKTLTWSNSLMKKFLSVISDDEQALQEFVFYHCRRFNNEKNRLKNFQIIRYRQKVTLYGDEEEDIESRIDWSGNCY